MIEQSKQGSIGCWSRAVVYLNELEVSGGPKIGYFYILLSHLTAPLASWCVQQLHEIPVSQILFFRGIILFIVSWMICSKQNIEFYIKSPSTNKKLFFRGLGSLVQFGLSIYGLHNLALSEAITLFQTVPVFTSLFAMYFLKEKFDTTQGITITMSLLGTLLVLKPPFLFSSGNTVVNNEDQNRYFGGICCLLTAITYSATYNLMRDLRNHCHSQTTVQYTAAVTALIAPLLIVFQGAATPTLEQYIYLMLMAFLMAASQILTTRGLKFSPAGKGSILGYSQILFSFIIDILSNHPLDIWSVIGAGCIFSCVFAILFEKKN